MDTLCSKATRLSTSSPSRSTCKNHNDAKVMNISEASRSIVTKYMCSSRPHNAILPTYKGLFNQVPWLNLGLHLWFPGSLQPHWCQPPTSKKQLSHIFIEQLMSTQSCRYYCFSKVSQKVKCSKIQTLGIMQPTGEQKVRKVHNRCMYRKRKH